jgi:glutathione S-transferase
MFGNHRKRGVSHRVQNWVDEGMEMVRDHAKQPAIWGAALSVAACALLGFAYRNRDELRESKVVSARVKKGARRAERAVRNAVRDARKKASASKKHA